MQNHFTHKKNPQKTKQTSFGTTQLIWWNHFPRQIMEEACTTCISWFLHNKFQNYIDGWNKHHNILFQKHGFKICVVKCSIYMYFLTTPSGSTNNKCLIMPFCLPLRTNWLGSLELFLTRKSPSFCRSFSACFLGRAPWYHSSNMGAMLFRLPVGFGLSGIGVPFIWGRVSHTALSSMGFSGTPFCLDLCLGGGNSALKGSK